MRIQVPLLALLLLCLPVAASAEPSAERSIGAKLLFYVPNRIFDVRVEQEQAQHEVEHLARGGR